MWARRVEAQRAQKVFMEAKKDNKEIDTTKRHEQKKTLFRAKSNRIEIFTSSKYYGNSYEQ